ncbi:hypothetical protein EVAR_16309_1 [Eumeta japonica]|uniref:Uncharacterized protein n=1 Tax=Eumeta variegata TaxID=151549 RepID=A0A4C1VHJ1_EUMVA|nr:hypothetical protein EVAR_16309_1 [Eumeta japonica]
MLNRNERECRLRRISSFYAVPLAAAPSGPDANSSITVKKAIQSGGVVTARDARRRRDNGAGGERPRAAAARNPDSFALAQLGARRAERGERGRTLFLVGSLRALT